jgi:hypothetical protein
MRLLPFRDRKVVRPTQAGELPSDAALAAPEAIRLLWRAHMDKRLTGVLAAAATVATVGAAQALPQASSYAELLASVPNSTEVLKADDQARAEGQARVQLVQYHHHHHHHRVFIRHHHHHHHHVIVIRRHRHHHHHHHRY